MPDFKFWNDKWIHNEIGFHMSAPHKSLIEFIDLFMGHKKILVPLCGKSPDLIYLKDKGFEVIGIEFSEIAILDFFKENNLLINKTILPDFILYQSEGIKIYQGDLFKMPKEYLNGITSCYDRASMVAFSFEERERYAKFLISNARDLIFMLAPVIDYGKILDAGPPFSVTEDELSHFYGKDFSLKMLKKVEVPLRKSFEDKGAKVEFETTWELKRKN